MATQLNLFDGIQGNLLGDPGKSVDDVEVFPELNRSAELDSLLEPTNNEPTNNEQTNNEPTWTETVEVSLNEIDAAAESVEQTRNTDLENGYRQPPSQSIRIVSESNVSHLHPNPYDPENYASVWAKIRAFFLKGFPD